MNATLTGTTTLGQSELGVNANKEVLHIPPKPDEKSTDFYTKNC